MNPNLPMQMPRTQPFCIRISAGGLADADHARPGPIALWIKCPMPSPAKGPIRADRPRILLISSPDDPAAPPHDLAIDRPESVLIPGLVNAHTHLDLTALAPRPHDPALPGAFTNWADMIRRERPATHESIADSVRLGVRLGLAGGVVAVGDIAGAAGGRATLTALDTLAESPIHGICFTEFFGIGTRAGDAMDLLPALAERLGARPTGRLRPGLQPHAPYSVSRAVYERAARLAMEHGLPISTHLAETLEEGEFVAHATGAKRAFLEALGLWSDAELADLGRGEHPVEHLSPILGITPFLLAHLNDTDDAAIGTLARTGASVAYCPRASAYFGAPASLGPHRYREMLEAGVNVSLGTDSIVNLDTPDRISVLDDARLLVRRDGLDARTAFAMMTTRGAAALGLDPDAFRFRPGASPVGVAAVPVGGGNPDASVFKSDEAPEILLMRSDSCFCGAGPGTSNA
jgi:cytosine/adenosine deaminase-related metal-dependent hydrolase